MSSEGRPVRVLLVGTSNATAMGDAFAAALGADLAFAVGADLAAARATLAEREVDAIVVDLTDPAVAPGDIAAAAHLGGDASVIALTTDREHAIAAMGDGAMDYLLHSVLIPAVVQTTLRYAAERAATLRGLRRSEEDARRATSLLAATLEATAEGVLVIGRDGTVTTWNRRFAEMWQVPETVLAAGDAAAVRGYMTHQMAPRDAVRSSEREDAAHAEVEHHDVLELLDSRVIERHARPQRVGDRVVGRVLSYRDVTERRAAAAALRQEHDLRTAIIESIGEAIFAKDLAGRYILLNAFAAQMMERSAATVLGQRDHEVFEPAVAQRYTAVDRQVTETGATVVLEERLGRDPDARHLLLTKGPLRDRNGAIIGVLGVARDVTEQRRSARAVRESEERYRAFLAESPEAVWRVEFAAPPSIDAGEDALLDQLHAGGSLAECNDAMARMYGRAAAADLVGTPLRVLLPRTDPQNEALLRALVRSGFRLVDVETREPRGGLDARVFLNSIVGIVEDGRLVRAWGTRRDVTERRRAELVQAATYQISEAAAAANGLDQLLPAIHRIVGTLVPADNSYVALLSDDGRELAFPFYVDEADTDFAPRPLGRGLTEYVLRTGQALLATPEVWERLLAAGDVELVGAPSIDWLGVPLIAEGRTIGVLACQSYRETTRYDEHAQRILLYVAGQVASAILRLRGAAALRASEERYRAFIEQSTEGVWRIEYDPPVPLAGRAPEEIAADLYAAGRVAECNHAMALMYGFDSVADVVNSRLDALYPTADPVNVRAAADFVNAGCRVVDAEIRTRDREGRIRLFRLNAVGFLEHGRLVRTWGSQRDVTEQRMLEEQLRQAQKLEAVGRLAGGIAHDFNNILTAILGTTDLMLGDLPEEHATRPDVVEVRKAALRAAELTRQLLTYSRRQVLLPRRVDLSAVVGGLDAMLRRLIGEDVELVMALAPDLPAITADPGQIEQVVLNLAVNARDAMPRGGRLRIETAAVTVGSGAVEPPAVPPGAYVLLSVVDTGVGMTAEVRAHVFEPFFTTKEVGKGTGLGLATVYGIVRQSDGHIAVDTAPGQGTAMRMYFPPAAAETPPPAADAEPRSTAPTGQTVLVVEDEAGVRTFARRALEGAGYRVLAAPDGAAALALADAHPGSIDLLLTDVVMPGMNGSALAARFGERWPDVPVIYMSGYAEDEGLRGTGSALLPKPFDAETLLRRVRQTLDLHSAAPRA